MNPLILFLPATLVPLLLIIPALIASRRQLKGETRFLPLVHIPAIIIWHQLLVRGYGALGLGNLYEMFAIGLAALLGVYLKVFMIDRHVRRPSLTSLILALLLCVLAVLLRSFMPVLRG